MSVTVCQVILSPQGHVVMLPQFSFRERKRFWTIFTMILLLLCLWLLFAPDGVIRYYRLQQEVKVVKEEAVSLDEQNGKLAEDVSRLQKIRPISKLWRVMSTV